MREEYRKHFLLFNIGIILVPISIFLLLLNSEVETLERERYKLLEEDFLQSIEEDLLQWDTEYTEFYFESEYLYEFEEYLLNKGYRVDSKSSCGEDDCYNYLLIDSSRTLFILLYLSRTAQIYLYFAALILLSVLYQIIKEMIQKR